MKRSFVSRRRFLADVGLGAALLPVLQMERGHAACVTTKPKRLILMNWPNGVTAWPGPATDAAGIRLPEFMKDLEPFKNDCLFIKGLRFRAVQESPNPRVPPDGHQSHAGLFTGKKAYSLVDKYSVADGPSVDQHIAEALVKNGFKGVPSLNLGVNHTYASTQWRGSQQPVQPNNDPYHVFDTLFGGGITGPEPDEKLEKLRRARKSVLDFVTTDLKRFTARVGAEDRHAIDAHLQSVRQIEKQLEPIERPNAAECEVPVVGQKLDLKASANFPTLWKLQMDLCVAAMAADVSRVAVIQVGNDSNHHLISTWFGHRESHHDIAHNGPSSQKVENDAWYVKNYAYLLGRLKELKEGDKSMLDSAAVVAVHNMEHGIHPINQVPWIIAGSCHGAFKTGRSLNFNAVPHNGVLIALANAMDVPTQTFGDAEYGGELAGLRV